jgi:hypothetical protein
MFERNVVSVTSRGSDCGICGKKICPGEAAIRVSFDVPILFASTRIDRELHVDCASHLAETILRVTGKSRS